VPAYVALPVVLACGLLGYAISLMAPLQPAPTDSAHPQPAQIAIPSAALETLPANEDPRVDTRSAATTDLSHDRIKIEPAAAQIPQPSPRPSVEPAAVDPPPRPSDESTAEPKVVPSAAATSPAQSHPEPQARRVPRKVRRIYRRPTAKPPAGPVEALFSLVK
jgi:hypothetical protein